MHLRESSLKANVHMICVRSEETFIVLIQQRKRTHIHAVIVIGQFKPRKHSLDQHTLTRSGFTYYADELVIRAQIHLRYLHTKIIDPIPAPWRKEDAVIVTVLHFA